MHARSSKEEMERTQALSFSKITTLAVMSQDMARNNSVVIRDFWLGICNTIIQESRMEMTAEDAMIQGYHQTAAGDKCIYN